MSVNLGTAYAELKLNKTSFNTSLAEAESQLTSFQKQMDVVSSGFTGVGTALSKAGSNLTKTVTAPIVGLGTAAMKTTAEFDSSMSKVQALSGATGEDFDALRAKALEMGSTTAFTASEAADALGYMALAGWDTEQMLSGIEGVMNLAAAGGSDLATTSDIVTDALSAFGYQAEDSAHFADVLATAMSKSNTSTEQLGEAFKYVGPVAGALSYNVEDVSVALGLMANVGVKGSQAGTSLRQALNNLIKPTKQSANAMAEFGIEMTNEDGTMKSFGEVMDMLREKLGGLTEAEQARAAGMLFGTRAMSGMLGIINATEEDYTKLTDAIYSADGASKTMADTMLNNLGGQLTILKSQIEGLMIQIGDILMPYVTKIVSKIQEIVKWFSELSDEQKEQILKWAGIAAAVGPVLLIFGKLSTSIGGLISTGSKLLSWISSAAKAFGILGGSGSAALGSIAAAAGPILAVVAALAALGVALKALYDQNGEFKESVDSLVSLVKDTVIGWLDKLKASWEDLMETLAPSIQMIKDSFDIEAIDSAMSGLVDAVSGLWEAVKPFIDGLIDFALGFLKAIFAPLISQIMGLINGVVRALAPFIETVKSVINIITDLFNIVKGLIVGLITGDFTSLKDAVIHLKDDIISFVHNLVDTIVSFVTGFFEGFYTTLNNFTGGVLDQIVEFIKNLWEKIVKFFTEDIPSTFKNFTEVTLPEFIAKAKKFFDELPYNLGLAVGEALLKIKQWGIDIADWAKREVPKIIDNIVSFFKELPGKIWQWLVEAVTKVSNWGNEMNDKANQVGRDFTDKIITWFKELPGKIWAWITQIPYKITAIGEDMYRAGEAILSRMWDGLKSIWNSISNWFSGIMSTVSSFVQGIKDKMSEASDASSEASSGSHADGLAYVPYNGYRATLHEGERVLTRNEAEAYNMGTGKGNYFFTFNSPKALDPYEANKQFKETVRRMEEGFSLG